MTHCNKVQEMFSLMLEDESSASERSSFDRHLAACSACREDYAAFTATSELVRTLSPIEPSPGFEDRVMSRIRAVGIAPEPIELPVQAPDDGGSFWTGWFPRLGLAAAAAAFIAFAFISMNRPTTGGSGAPQMAGGSQGIETLKERLPDLPDEVVNALNEESYVLDRMVVRPGSGQGDVRVVAPVGYESGPVYVAF